jgi:hypothetical protein
MDEDVGPSTVGEQACHTLHGPILAEAASDLGGATSTARISAPTRRGPWSPTSTPSRSLALPLVFPILYVKILQEVPAHGGTTHAVHHSAVLKNKSILPKGVLWFIFNLQIKIRS